MKDFILVLPEVVLGLTLGFIVLGEITYHGEKLRLTAATALLGLGGAFLQILMVYQYGAAQAFGHTLSIDGLALFFKMLFVGSAALTIVGAMHTREIPTDRRTEFFALIVASTLGMCLAASASDMLLAFLSLQFLNVVNYFLAGFGKNSFRSAEASVKHLIFGVAAGGLLLYSLALLFGATKSLNIYEMHRALMVTPLPQKALIVSFLLALLSFCFQVGAFPMHLWTPDVLEGAPTPVSAFISLGSRAAGFAVAIRFFFVVYAQPALAPGQWTVLGRVDWTHGVAVIAGLSMIFGALLALRQSSAKRLVGCLVVTGAGQLMLGMLVLDEVGIAALLYNLVIELFALIGIYYILAFFYEELNSDQFKDLRGMMGRAVFECICLVVFLASLVGLPPLPGFIGKFTLIGAVLRHGLPVLAAVAIASIVISTVAVSRLFFHLIGDFGRDGQATLVASSTKRKAFLAVLIFPLLLTGVLAEPLLSLAGQSLGFILW